MTRLPQCFLFKRHIPCKNLFLQVSSNTRYSGAIWLSLLILGCHWKFLRKIQTSERCLGCLHYGQHSVFLTDWNFLITTTQKYFSLHLQSWEKLKNHSTNFQIVYISWGVFKLKHYRYDGSCSFTRAGDIRWKRELHGRKQWASTLSNRKIDMHDQLIRPSSSAPEFSTQHAHVSTYNACWSIGGLIRHSGKNWRLVYLCHLGAVKEGWNRNAIWLLLQPPPVYKLLALKA